MSSLPCHSELWWCDLGTAGVRPIVVLTRDATIPRLRRVMVAPCTTTVRGLDTEVALDPDHDAVDRACVVNLDSIETVAIDAFVERLGVLGLDRSVQVCDALEIAVDCPR